MTAKKSKSKLNKEYGMVSIKTPKIKHRYWTNYKNEALGIGFANTLLAASETEAHEIMARRNLGETMDDFRNFFMIGNADVASNDHNRLGWEMPSHQLESIIKDFEENRSYFDGSDDRYDANFYKNPKLCDPMFCKKRDDLIHGLTFMAMMATTSKAIDPMEFLNDHGLLHAAIHYCNGAYHGEFGFERAQELGAELSEKLKEAENKIPGWS